MKSEAEFCTVISNSMINGFKIPDPSGNFAATSKRAFDGIGTLLINDELRFVCWEAKLLKHFEAFSLKRVEPHQNYYLREYAKAKGIVSYLILGIDIDRTDKRAYIFEYSEYMSQLYEQGFSFHKKVLEKLPFNEIKKGHFDFVNIITDKEISEAING